MSKNLKWHILFSIISQNPISCYCLIAQKRKFLLLIIALDNYGHIGAPTFEKIYVIIWKIIYGKFNLSSYCKKLYSYFPYPLEGALNVKSLDFPTFGGDTARGGFPA